MVLRYELRDGLLQAIQSFDHPAVYFDHWALTRISSDTDLSRRFTSALKGAGGTLVLSHLNLAETTRSTDARHPEEIATFLNDVLPNVCFAMFDVGKAVQQERDAVPGAPLVAPPDLEMLREVARRRPACRLDSGSGSNSKCCRIPEPVGGPMGHLK